MEETLNSEKGTPSPKGRSSGRKAVMRTWIMGVVLGVLAFAFAVPVYFTATPKQCATCHEMEIYYDSWQASSHREAAPTCLYCHVEPGILNLVRYEVEFYGEIVGHLLGAEVKMAGVSTPGLESCDRDECHSQHREVSSQSTDIAINHEVHADEEGIACPKCHPGAVHEGVAGRSRTPPMESCRECHADQMGDCEYCHIEEPARDVPETHETD